MSTNKPLNRFVPTLTEVVHSAESGVAPPLDRERLAEQVLLSVKPRLEQQLRASLQALVDEQMRLAAPRWQQEIEDAVKVAVEQAMAAHSNTRN